MYKGFILVLLIIISKLQAQQKNYYILFQSANQKPFFVKYKNKPVSSSPTGYLILPKLQNGIQSFSIGFPKSFEKDINFNTNITNTDLGFKIVQNANTIQLLNLIDLSVTSPTNQLDTNIVATIPVISNISKPQPIIPNSQSKATITLNFLKKTKQGIDAIYITNAPKNSDTIRIFIPLLSNTNIPTTSIDSIKFVDVTPVTIIPTPNSNPIDTISSKPIPILTIVNSDCKKIATENDYLLLRKKMAETDDESIMFEIVQKYISKKCYTTQQIKKLSIFFTTDNNKVEFYKKTYPYIYDSNNFSTLSQTIIAPGAVQNFNNILKK